jgi:hypothetical protein
MPARNCKTRPVSWKTHRNKALADAVIKMGEYYKDFKKGFIVWPVWIGFLTHRDNVGYFDGAAGIMRDNFFPHFTGDSGYPEVTPEEVKIIRDIFTDVGLIIKYQVNGIDYVLVPKVSNWSRIVGNISDKTDFPLPPKDVIMAWEQRFNEVYTPLIRCSNDVYTPHKRRIYDVSTESKSKIEIENKYIIRINTFFDFPPKTWLNEIKKTYPKINLETELSKMRAWLISNPASPKNNFKRFAVNWLNHPRAKMTESDKEAAAISGRLFEERLGKIATKDMIKKLMREIPQEAWWQIDRFLRKRYPGSDNRAFMEAERELIAEARKAKETISSITAGIGRQA